MWTAEHRAAYMKEYRAKYREGIKAMEAAWKDKYRDDINRRARKRYHEDAAYRERLLAKAKSRRLAKRTERRQPDAGA